MTTSNKIIEEAESDILYHYTSMSTLQSILERVEKEDKKNTEKALILRGTDIEYLNDEREDNKKPLILRGTHVEYLNDDKEFKLACEVMSEVIKEYEATLGSDSKEIAKCFKPEKWEELAQRFRFGYMPFVTSFSEEPDSLPMWNTYGDNGVGVAIGISKKSIENSYMLKECIYNREKFKQDMKELLVKDVYNNYCVKGGTYSYTDFGIKIDMLRTFCIYKHDAYEYEKEWRLIKLGNGFSSPTIVNFHEQNGLLKPYIEHSFVKDALKKIIIGPCANKELAKSSLEMCLHRAGFSRFPRKSNYVKVENSKAPFRQI